MNRERLAERLPALLNGLYRWLALQAAKRWVSLMLIAGIMVMDLSLPWQGWSFTVRALLDEPCHQATGLICLGTITRFRGLYCWPRPTKKPPGSAVVLFGAAATVCWPVTG